MKAFVDARGRGRRRVLLMGDFNVTDREPANAELSRGLRDAHDAAWGAGASWGPLALRRHGLALIRIDRILGGPGTVPTASARTARSTAATTASCTRRRRRPLAAAVSRAGPRSQTVAPTLNGTVTVAAWPRSSVSRTWYGPGPAPAGATQ